MSIEVDATKVAEEVRQAAQESITEEDLRVRIENILRGILEPLGVPWARYERRTVVTGSRSDALYGNLIIEYERPESFKTEAGFARAVEQLKGYISDEANRGKVAVQRYFGVAIDGFKIGFVHYNARLRDWDVEKPVATNKYSILKLLEAIRGLARKPLDADLLIKDLGPGSKVAKDVVKVLYERISYAKVERSKMLYEDWRRVFSQVCSYSVEKIRGLEQVYGIEKDKVDYEALLFTVHTYYALVMKLLAAEVAVLFGGFFLKSYTKKLESAYLKSSESFRIELKELEEGGVFVDLGIENFLEADYFGWYIDEWNEEVANAIISVAKKLSEYEPGTAELEPDAIRDLFKRLYQNLVPKTIRHGLGEYYTPDWLAELLLNEVGFSEENFEKLSKEGGAEAPFSLRLLDPACGSGTFLVFAIKRIKQYAVEHFLEEKALTHITKNIVGFDLNPLAVMASRANYLLALGELIRGASAIELPVYFADSILAERKSTIAGIEYALKTVVGIFSVPVSIVERGIFGKALSLVEECIHQNCSPRDFKERLSGELLVEDDNEIAELVSLFSQMLKLERAGKNKIWTRVLKNSFAPLFMGKFNFVVGNPPWINWENLPEDYRNATSSLWELYGLRLALSSQQVGLGKRGRDLSMLFTYACLDRYLIDSGMLGFLITNMVFKTGSVAGFRRFSLPSGRLSFRVVKVHDMISINPFEGASNMTSAIIMQRGSATKYPVPYIRWTKTEKGRIGNVDLNEAMQRCRVDDLVAVPVDRNDLTSPWLTAKSGILGVLSKVQGKPAYNARQGENTGGANGIYWVKIDKKLPSGLLFIENLQDAGNKEVRNISASIESTLVRKLVCSRNVERWKWKSDSYAVIPHTVKTSWRAIPESEMRTKFPNTYNYFLKFKDLLGHRPDYILRRKKFPFYIVFNTHSHSFAPFKVIWKRIASKIEATVISPVDDSMIGKKSPVLQETISYIPSTEEEEVHYLCAVLNSIEVNSLLKSFSQVGGKSFATPSILQQIEIPRFNSDNAIHRKLSSLSMKAHEFKDRGNEEELRTVESQVDTQVAELYGLSSKELRALKEQCC